eukprot:c24620_g11_i1 orf=563-1528(+)
MHELPFIDDLIAAIQKCRKEKILVHAKNLHSQIHKLGLDTHESIGNYLVPMFVECGSLSYAQKAFDRLHHRNEHSWTSIISGYVEYGQVQHALDMYRKMQEDFAYPSCYTIMALIKAYAKLSDVERAQEVHAQSVNNGFDRDVYIGSSLVHMYAKCGLPFIAQQVFDKLPVRDVVSWTVLIAGYAEYGYCEKSLYCYERMKLNGICPNAVTFICSLKACGCMGASFEGIEIHTEIARNGLLIRDNRVGNALLDMYVKCGLLAKAQELFYELPVQDIVSWTTLIVGYTQHERGEEALNCFDQMQLQGISPDAVMFVCSLKAC